MQKKKKLIINIRKFKKIDARETGILISETFSTFNKKEGSPDAVRRYVGQYSKNRPLSELIKDFNQPIFFLAFHKNRIVGMIRGGKERIVNLFVLGKYHNLGIGGLLLKTFEKEAKKQKSKRIKIRASLYATKFYQQHRYKKTTGIRAFHGLKIQPMKKILY